MPPLQAALVGSRQIGFTVLSISISLVAVFIPLIFMGGILGRLFHEFAMTMTLAIAVSAAVSLSLTPMLCGRYMRVRRAPARAVLGPGRRRDGGRLPRQPALLCAHARLGAAAPRVHAAGDRADRRADGAALYSRCRKASCRCRTPASWSARRRHRPTSPSPPWKIASARWSTCCWPIRRWRRCRAGSASAPAGRR